MIFLDFWYFHRNNFFFKINFLHKTGKLLKITARYPDLGTTTLDNIQKCMIMYMYIKWNQALSFIQDPLFQHQKVIFYKYSIIHSQMLKLNLLIRYKAKQMSSDLVKSCDLTSLKCRIPTSTSSIWRLSSAPVYWAYTLQKEDIANIVIYLIYGIYPMMRYLLICAYKPYASQD